MERDNRKSHLAPQLSPATQDLLRSSDSPTYQTTVDDRSLATPTSGDIPIAGAGIISPRDMSSRSPTRNGIGLASLARGPGPSGHPGLGQRIITTNSIPKIGQHPDSAGPASASAATFSLPVRPAPGGPLPPPPPRKETPDEMRRENRRQATFGMPPNGYGLGYNSAQ
jgi:mitogen-activated protein kinase kinase